MADVGRQVAQRVAQRGLPVVVAGFLISRTLVWLLLGSRGDTLVYLKHYAIPAIDHNAVAYKDVVVHYPPVAWWAIALPWLLAREPGANDEDFDPRGESPPPFTERYRRLFATEMFVCDLAAFGFFVAALRRRRPELTAWLALIYVCFTSTMCELLYGWLDVGLLMFVMAWAWCWARSLEAGSRQRRWAAAAYFVLGLSISYKVVPIVMTPFLLLGEWQQAGRRLRPALAGAGWMVLGAGLPFAVHAPTAGWSPFYLFLFHGVRPLQAESFWATLTMLASLFGLPIEYSMSHGAHAVTSRWTPWPEFASGLLTLASFTAAGVWAWRRGERYDRACAYRLACASVGVALLWSKVFSTTYLLWTMPLWLLLAAEVLPSRATVMLILLLSTCAIAAMTIYVFPHNFFDHPDALGHVPPLPTSSMIVLIARNFAYLSLVIWLLTAMFCHPGGRQFARLR